MSAAVSSRSAAAAVRMFCGRVAPTIAMTFGETASNQASATCAAVVSCRAATCSMVPEARSAPMRVLPTSSEYARNAVPVRELAIMDAPSRAVSWAGAGLVGLGFTSGFTRLGCARCTALCCSVAMASGESVESCTVTRRAHASYEASRIAHPRSWNSASVCSSRAIAAHVALRASRQASHAGTSASAKSGPPTPSVNWVKPSLT